MSKSCRITGAFLSIVVALVSAAPGQAKSPEVCRRVNARLATVVFMDGCLSPIGVCAEGVIARDRLIRGRTDVTMLSLQPIDVSYEPPTTLSFVGDRLIETRRGNLNLRITGSLDTARGEFAELMRVESGTGRFENATGTLYLTGTSNAEGTEFFGDVTGRVCYPGRPGDHHDNDDDD